MKRYGPLRKIMIIVLLSILGSYCFGVDSYKERFKDSLHQAFDSVQVMTKSCANYSYNLWSEFVGKVKNLFSGQEEDTVKIQYMLKKSPPAKDVDTHEDFYLDYEKCTDNTEDCEFNEHFFGDTYYATGEENIDDVIQNDFSKDPVVAA